MTIQQYAKEKDAFVNRLLDEAVGWYKQRNNYIHIGDFDEIKKQWSCCKVSNDEYNENLSRGDFRDDVTGCYQPRLKKDSYHPGRYFYTEYNAVRGWWTCCSQGRHGNGCVKLRFLANGDGKDLEICPVYRT